MPTIDDVACTLCGCVCDDLALQVSDGRVVAANRACVLAEPWMLRQTSAELPAARIDGQPVALEIAVRRSAEILHQARSPLIYGLSRSSTSGQRAAVRLADQLGATIDTTASTCHAPSIMALQTVGESTSTLGEIKNRADLVIYWGSNPLESHPRHVERYVESTGMFVPAGRRDRHVVVVDTQRTETAELADSLIHVEPGGDFELIWALRMLCSKDPILAGGTGNGTAASIGPPFLPETVAGVPREQIAALAERLKGCRYGAVFFGLGLTAHAVPHANVEALLRLVTDLNAHTRFVARRMRVPGDVAGADSVLCWQTGFPFSVNMARGYPRYNPGEYTANILLERGEADAVVMVGSEGIGKLSTAAQRHLQSTDNIVLDYPTTECPIPATVQFTTAVYGIHRPGTAYRMDEVPIPLRRVLDSPLPSDDEVLRAIGNRLRAGHQVLSENA